MDVWIVEAGDNYESARATVVCSTEEKAEALRARWERNSDADWVSCQKYRVDEHEPDHSHIT